MGCVQAIDGLLAAWSGPIRGRHSHFPPEKSIRHYLPVVAHSVHSCDRSPSILTKKSFPRDQTRFRTAGATGSVTYADGRSASESDMRQVKLTSSQLG